MHTWLYKYVLLCLVCVCVCVCVYIYIYIYIRTRERDWVTGWERVSNEVGGWVSQSVSQRVRQPVIQASSELYSLRHRFRVCLYAFAILYVLVCICMYMSAHVLLCVCARVCVYVCMLYINVPVIKSKITSMSRKLSIYSTNKTTHSWQIRITQSYGLLLYSKKIQRKYKYCRFTSTFVHEAG